MTRSRVARISSRKVAGVPGSLLGTEVVRVEDPELLEGRGTFIGNLTVPGLLHVGFVRSPHAHALVTGIDVSEAQRLPGVVATFTHADLDPLLRQGPHRGLRTAGAARRQGPLRR